jgi:hypothetical protein
MIFSFVIGCLTMRRTSPGSKIKSLAILVSITPGLGFWGEATVDIIVNGVIHGNLEAV